MTAIIQHNISPHTTNINSLESTLDEVPVFSAVASDPSDMDTIFTEASASAGSASSPEFNFAQGRKRKFSDRETRSAKRMRHSKKTFSISHSITNATGKTFSLTSLNTIHKLNTLHEDAVHSLAQTLGVPFQPLHELWQAAKLREAEDSQIKELLDRNDIEDSDDADQESLTDSVASIKSNSDIESPNSEEKRKDENFEETEQTSATEYVQKIKPKYDFLGRIPPSPEIDASDKPRRGNMGSLQLETWTEQERKINEKLVMQASIHTFFSNREILTLSGEQLDQIVVDHNFDPVLVDELKKTLLNTQQRQHPLKLKGIKSRFELEQSRERMQEEINAVSWWEMSEEENEEILQAKRWDRALVEEVIQTQRKHYQRILHDARYHARRLAGCAEDDLARLVQELKVPMHVISKEIQRYQKQVEKRRSLEVERQEEMYMPAAPESEDEKEMPEIKQPTQSANSSTTSKSALPQAWTAEEEAQLTALVCKYGNDWDTVSNYMSRSRGAVSVHWCMMKKRSREAEENIAETQFRGVTKRLISGCYKPYIASIFHKGKWRKIGVFKTARDAARAYDVEALRLLGPESELNFKYSQETQDMYENLKKRKLLRKSNMTWPKFEERKTATVSKRKRRTSKRLSVKQEEDFAPSQTISSKRQAAIEQSECVPNVCTFCGGALTTQKIQCKRCKHDSYCSTSCFVNNYDNHLQQHHRATF